jgi:hypothetical protein
MLYDGYVSVKVVIKENPKVTKKTPIRFIQFVKTIFILLSVTLSAN